MAASPRESPLLVAHTLQLTQTHAYMKPNYQLVICTDGHKVSIQASQFHYCEPRNDIGPYTSIEAGFPSGEAPASWMKYAETQETPNETVYGYMPVELVQDYIQLHGGMESGQLPPGVILT